MVYAIGRTKLSIKNNLVTTWLYGELCYVISDVMNPLDGLQWTKMTIEAWPYWENLFCLLMLDKWAVVWMYREKFTQNWYQIGCFSCFQAIGNAVQSLRLVRSIFKSRIRRSNGCSETDHSRSRAQQHCKEVGLPPMRHCLQGVLTRVDVYFHWKISWCMIYRKWQIHEWIMLKLTADGQTILIFRLWVAPSSQSRESDAFDELPPLVRVIPICAHIWIAIVELLDLVCNNGGHEYHMSSMKFVAKLFHAILFIWLRYW